MSLSDAKPKSKQDSAAAQLGDPTGSLTIIWHKTAWLKTSLFYKPTLRIFLPALKSPVDHPEEKERAPATTIGLIPLPLQKQHPPTWIADFLPTRQLTTTTLIRTRPKRHQHLRKLLMWPWPRKCKISRRRNFI
ncbi:hypothetical protein H4Q26_007002 [Puccinia striiformis f. sp. tritici PST-130]|uniref:Uncharacterized protein n=1 Tax=Puccinia striiformis f. sp. tritici PST-78 TaxID=1165861 RepID=A0A0L0W3F1_9BASI|nr:hypothetical protein H4Q26_007002 [Puccinia striiformis f. sp. tritici PST-130]KNF06014.1 hypothetical protein PSTG_01006 [Puccinia striiformis f. sp. tritici PST-78]